jgi:DNA ligase-1
MFKPMLAVACPDDLTQIKFPVLCSKKLDGIRCMVQGGILVSRTLKPIPNKNVQAMFKGLPEGTDGELIAGDITARSEAGDSVVFRNTTSVVMSYDKPADFAGRMGYYVFDQFRGTPGEGFERRLRHAHNGVDIAPTFRAATPVQHVLIANAEDLVILEELWLNEGHEGVMIRSVDGPYKQGRSTEREGYLLKLKQFEDAEARVIGFEEEQKNTNAAMTNLLGRTERSTAKAGMIGKGTLGKFLCIALDGKYAGAELSVGGGLDADERKKFWADRDNLIGKIVKYKYFAHGGKDAPRFPVYLGLRDKEDM